MRVLMAPAFVRCSNYFRLANDSDINRHKGVTNHDECVRNARKPGKPGSLTKLSLSNATPVTSATDLSGCRFIELTTRESSSNQILIFLTVPSYLLAHYTSLHAHYTSPRRG
jgi:hypothetical protein